MFKHCHLDERIIKIENDQFETMRKIKILQTNYDYKIKL